MVHEREVIPFHNRGSLGLKLIALLVTKACLKMVLVEKIFPMTLFSKGLMIFILQELILVQEDSQIYLSGSEKE